MLDEKPVRRVALELYVDAGPLARDIGYAMGRLRLPEIPLLLLAGTIMGGVLVGFDGSLGWRQALFGTVCGVVVLTGLCWSGPVRGRFGWLLPALVRAIEYAFVIRTTAVFAPDLLWLAYLYLVAVAFHHTDTVARLRHLARGPARWVYTAGLGYDGRMLVVAALVVAGEDTFRPGLAILAGALAGIYVLECLLAWLVWWRSQPRKRRRGGGRHRSSVADVAEWADAGRGGTATEAGAATPQRS